MLEEGEHPGERRKRGKSYLTLKVREELANSLTVKINDEYMVIITRSL